MPALGLILGLFLGFLVGAAYNLTTPAAIFGGALGFLLGLLINEKERVSELGEKLQSLETALAELERNANRADLISSVATRVSALETQLREQRNVVPAAEPPPQPIFEATASTSPLAAALEIPTAKIAAPFASSASVEEIAEPVDDFVGFADEPSPSPAVQPTAMAAAPAELAQPMAEMLSTPGLSLEPIAEEVAPPVVASVEAPVTSAKEPAEASSPTPPALVVLPSLKASAPEVPDSQAAPRPRSARTPPRPSPVYVEPEPNFIERGFTAARDWLFGGNTLVRMGLVLVFMGLAFLLRYASARVVIPLEVRYLAVAGAALAALVLGWRLREKRPAYALLMQGGSVAVMYLTVFAALKLHGDPLLPTQLGLLLLIAVAGLSGVLAITQNAMSLAVAGSLGGFAGPVLVSTGGGSHVALFSYFALLNTVILGIAWFKAWRPLNLIGFFGTFLIGLAWGLRSYQPAHYATTQPFLILFFLMFVGIGLLFARRMLLDDPDVPSSDKPGEWMNWLAQQGHRAQRYVDGTILFGTPLVGFGLQYAITKPFEYGPAISAFLLGLFYMLMARVVHASQPIRCRLLTEVFLALGVVFASLAIPLGLDAEWTSAAWAVEAAGIYWIGHQQKRPFARAFALLLQAGAGLTYLSQVHAGDETVLRGSPLGALMLGLSMLSNMIVHIRHVNERARSEVWDGGLRIIFSTLGLWSLFLIAPLLNPVEGTAVSLALAGMVAVALGLQFRLEGWQGNALIALLFAMLGALGTLHPGSDTLIEGTPVVIFIVGAAVLGSVAAMRWFLRREDHPAVLTGAMPLFSTAGLWFLYLIAPLCLDIENTAAAWAIASVAVIAVGLRLRLQGWQGNALIAFLLAMCGALNKLHPGLETVINGSPLIVLLIGASLLASVAVMRWFLLRGSHPEQVFSSAMPWLSTFGLWFLYLIAPLCLNAENTAAAWSLAGLLTAFIGIRLQARAWLGNALLVQLAAGLLFILKLHGGDAAGGVLSFGGSGWNGLVIAMLVGLASLVSIGLAVQDARRRDNEASVQRLAWLMVFGLGFISLAVLFVLPWQTATAVWAASGFLLMWAAQRVRLAPAFWFAVMLEGLAGLAFATTNVPRLVTFSPELTAFGHMGFWTPLIIALSAFALAWRLHCVARNADQGKANSVAASGRIVILPALLWAAAWWAFGWKLELVRLAIDAGWEVEGHQFLAAMAASVLVLLFIALRWRWSQLAGLCLTLLPLTILNALGDYQSGVHLFGGWGLLGFSLALLAQFAALRVAPGLLSAEVVKKLNLVANWVLLLVASLEVSHLFLALGDEGSSWRWLGWVLPLAAWLLWSARRTAPRLWPAVRLPELYRFSTTLPLVVVLLGWLVLANLQASGNSSPLPYLPIANPLELAMLLTLFASWRWLDRVEETSPHALSWQPLHEPLRLVVLGATFLTYTCAVLRGVHHFANVAYAFGPLMHSMVAQASLSLAWSLCAIGLMIAGNRVQRREVWITGAVLVGIVFVKLMFIELSNRGGLERIVSFIGVGVLLLVVGYFAPVPARKEN